MGSNQDPYTWSESFLSVRTSSGMVVATVDSIKKQGHTICQKGYEITKAECEALASVSPLSVCSDILYRNCTTEGLICRNQDQPFRPSCSVGKSCQNYTVRFRCHKIGDTEKDDDAFPQFDVRIYIILAVVPVLIFLIRILWTYVFRKRRQQRRNQRRERRRQNRANGDFIDDDSTSIDSGLAKPPPSYHELFGKTGIGGTGSSVFAISRNNIPICSKCESESCSVASIIGKQSNGKNTDENQQTEPSGTSVFQEQELQQRETGSDTANENNVSGVADTSTQESTLSSMTSPQEETNSSVDSGQDKNDFTEIDLTNASPPQDNALEDRQGQDTTNFYIENENSDQNSLENNTSGSLQASASTSTSLEPINPTLSLNPSLLKSLNISKPCACACHRTIPLKHEGAAGFDNQGYTKDGDYVDAYSSFPGMHVPVFGIHRVQSDLSVSSVPQAELPSYNVALELMKKKQKEAESEQIAK